MHPHLRFDSYNQREPGHHRRYLPLASAHPYLQLRISRLRGNYNRAISNDLVERRIPGYEVTQGFHHVWQFDCSDESVTVLVKRLCHKKMNSISLAQFRYRSATLTLKASRISGSASETFILRDLNLRALRTSFRKRTLAIRGQNPVLARSMAMMGLSAVAS